MFPYMSPLVLGAALVVSGPTVWLGRRPSSSAPENGQFSPEVGGTLADPIGAALLASDSGVITGPVIGAILVNRTSRGTAG